MANCSRPSWTGRRRPDRAVIVASTVSSDAHLEVLQLQDAAREAGVEEVVTVLPYMGYARQDAAFEAGHPVSARAVARSISTGADRLLTANPTRRQSASFRADGDGRRRCGSTGRATARRPRGAGLSLPDAGAIDLAETVRDAAGAGETDYFEKTRHSGTDVEISRAMST